MDHNRRLGQYYALEVPEEVAGPSKAETLVQIEVVVEARL
jgi:hypothetical protein